MHLALKKVLDSHKISRKRLKLETNKRENYKLPGDSVMFRLRYVKEGFMACIQDPWNLHANKGATLIRQYITYSPDTLRQLPRPFLSLLFWVFMIHQYRYREYIWHEFILYYRCSILEKCFHFWMIYN